MTTKNTRLLGAATVLATLALITGCSQDQSRVDAHDVQNQSVNRTPPEAYVFNNHFPNVESRCDQHGHRMFVTTSDNVIVLPDPSCPGFLKGQEPIIVATSPSGTQ